MGLIFQTAFTELSKIVIISNSVFFRTDIISPFIHTFLWNADCRRNLRRIYMETQKERKK
jgi:hypothetical protein